MVCNIFYKIKTANFTNIFTNNTHNFIILNFSVLVSCLNVLVTFLMFTSWCILQFNIAHLSV